MAKICILSTLLLQLLYISVQGSVQNSPCPDRFTYIKKPGSDETIGQIEIRNPPRNNLELRLKVDLKVATQLPTSFNGGVDLTKSKEDAARDVLEGKPLLYHIRFPVQNPLPKVHRIWFNNEQICSGPEVSGNTVTTISMQHTMKITIQSPQNQPNPPPQYRPAERSPTVSLSLGIGDNIFLHPNKQKPIPQSSNNKNSFINPSGPPRNTNNYKTNPFLPHKPDPPRTTSASQGYNNYHPVVTINPNRGHNPFLPPKPPPKTPHPPSRPTPPKPPVHGNYHECGISSISGSLNLLIVNGNTTLRGQWPWITAIFTKVGIKHEYICGGTVLTTRHILTAGHCLKTPGTNQTIPPNILVVALGRYKLFDFNEEGSVTREIARHISHPEYTNSPTADHDLAILILRSPVEFSALIRPICLWSQSINPYIFEERNGIVVGWGADEAGNSYTEEPRLVAMPIVTAEVCLRSHPLFSSITSERTFCAGWRRHSGPCNGDSGSGLMVFDSVKDHYQLRGIVSRSLTGKELICDQRQYIVFVDVFKYIPWINRQIDST